MPKTISNDDVRRMAWNIAFDLFGPRGLTPPEPAALPSCHNPPMAERRFGGITLGGIIVILGVIVLILWSFWLGLIIALIGLIAFGGFARGKWY
jgi:hypothetical protein